METKTKLKVGSGIAAIGAITFAVRSLVFTQPKVHALPDFRYDPSIVLANYNWSIEGSSNLVNWIPVAGMADSNWIYFTTNNAPVFFYRAKGVHK